MAFRILHGAERDNLNIRGATLHVLADALGSVAAIAAGIVIIATGWTPIDPILSVLITGLILRSALALVVQSGHVLMEGAPQDLDVAALRQSVADEVAGVLSVHHVHAWSLKPGQTLLTMHVEIGASAAHDDVLHRVQAHLAERFGIDHATIQVECGPCAEDHHAPVSARGSGPVMKTLMLALLTVGFAAAWSGMAAASEPARGSGCGDSRRLRCRARRGDDRGGELGAGGAAAK